MKLKYWTDFSKRKNSTKQPLDTQAVEIDIKLKDDCSIINPVIQSSSIPINANYFYIADYGRYYYLDNTERTSNQLKDISTEVDVLATYKTQIGATTAHIAYSSTGWDKDIVDGRMCVQTDKLMYQTSGTSLGLDKTGCYVIGVINNVNDGKVGAISYYALDTWSATSLFNSMLDHTFLQDIDQYFNGKTIDLITTCFWLPVTVGELVAAGCISSTSFQINLTLGKETIPCQNRPIDNPIGTLKVNNYTTRSIAIPYKWQDFRDCQPYSSLSLWLPGIGLTDLNINDFYDSNNVNITTRIDCTTGDMTYFIRTDDTTLVKSISFNGGCNVPMAQITTGAAGAMMAIGGCAGGVVAGGVTAAMGNIPGVITSGVGLMAGASSAVIQAMQRSTSLKGTNNGRSAFSDINAYLYEICCRTEDVDDASYIARCGRPVGVTHAISNHSGYVQCEGASCNMPGTAVEKDRVNSYLNSGFFYE